MHTLIPLILQIGWKGPYNNVTYPLAAGKFLAKK